MILRNLIDFSLGASFASGILGGMGDSCASAFALGFLALAVTLAVAWALIDLTRWPFREE